MQKVYYEVKTESPHHGQVNWFITINISSLKLCGFYDPLLDIDFDPYANAQNITQKLKCQGNLDQKQISFEDWWNFAEQALSPRA